MQQNNISIFHPDVRIVTPELVKTIRAKGHEIFPFVSMKNEENTHDMWSYLMTLGVDGLCTNYPRQLKLWLKEASDDKQRFGAINSLGTKEDLLTR